MSLSVETYGTLSEAAQALGQDGRYLGGGTIVMRAANYGDQTFRRIIRTEDAGLRSIRMTGDRMEIGAGATMADVLAARDAAFLHAVARQVGGPAVRNMATVGGNLFAEHPYGDFATALLALDAVVKMADGREAPMEAFLADRARAGLVASIICARPRDGEFRWRKVSRVKPKGVSVMAIAAWLPGGSRIQNARVAFGAMGSTPLRAKSAEQALEGGSLDEQGVARACAVCCEGLAPADDALASAWYRREVAPVHLKRLLTERAR